MAKCMHIGKNVEYFISTRDTTNPWVSAANQITIPMIWWPYRIDRWDGNVDAWVSWTQTHTYASPWVYTLKVRSNIPMQIQFGWWWDAPKILTIDNRWINWNDFWAAFQGCVNLQLNAIDIPKWPFTWMWRMFAQCTNFAWDAIMQTWDVSNVTDFFQMFLSCPSFNLDIWSRDVSSAIGMSWMFANATSFNQDISWWDVSNVQNFDQTFLGAGVFNQPIWSWDVSSATNIRQMFSSATAFNQDLSWWDVSNVTNMFRTFYLASNFDQDIWSWDVSNVNNIEILFTSPLSTANYNALLIWWAALTLQNGVVFEAQWSTYNFWAPESARLSIITNYSWTINDWGPV